MVLEVWFFISLILHFIVCLSNNKMSAQACDQFVESIDIRCGHNARDCWNQMDKLLVAFTYALYFE
jgi:hypothetical protein